MNTQIENSLAQALYDCITDGGYIGGRVAAVNKIACDALRAAGYDPVKTKVTPKPQTQQELQSRLIAAVNDLLEATGSASFSIPIPNTSPTVYIMVGNSEQILRRLNEIDK